MKFNLTPSKFLWASLFTFGFLSNTSFAQSCGVGSLCAISTPCCSSYGYCGTGPANCLGGCDPFGSHSPSSCMPQPICVSKNHTFTDLSKFVNLTSYNGDPSKYDFTMDVGVPLIQNDTLILTMNLSNNGTKISTTRYVYYGTISATMQLSSGQGVVTAFITMSDIKDEIDWEFLGSKPSVGASNYFYQGIADYTHGGKSDIGSDGSNSFHTYTIDWQEDEINWLIDGKLVRTLKKSDTLNSTTGQYSYPSTPSRVQFSIWPGGAASQPPGVISWAGGPISWESPPMPSVGYYFVQVQSLSIQCAGIPSSVTQNSTSPNAYQYLSANSANITLLQGVTQLVSNASTGLNPKASGQGINNNPTGNSNPGTNTAGESNQSNGDNGDNGSSGGLFTTSSGGASMNIPNIPLGIILTIGLAGLAVFCV